jgi:DNA-binding MarR family transcriptional regulator
MADSEAETVELDFGELGDRVGYLLRKVHFYAFQSFNELLGEHGIAPGQYSLLLLIGRNPGMTQMALAAATRLDRSTIALTVDRFVKKGWVKRVRRKDDRRAYALQLSAAGEKLLALADPLIEQHERELTAPLSEAEHAKLVKLLTKLLVGFESRGSGD